MSTPSLPIAADGAFGASPSAAADAVATPPLPGAAAATTDATPDVPPPAPAAASGVAGSTASLGEGAGNADAQPSASKTRFYQLLSEREEKSEGPTGAKYLTREEYDYATSVLVDWQPMVKHERNDYNIQKKFFVGQGIAGNSLREKKSGKKVAIREDLFDVIDAAHRQLSHCQTARNVKKSLDTDWHGITSATVQLCIDVCAACVAKKVKIVAKQPPLKMMTSPTIGYRVQIDLIDMTSQPTDDGHKWILRYHDHCSGFAQPVWRSGSSRHVPSATGLQMITRISKK